MEELEEEEFDVEAMLIRDPNSSHPFAYYPARSCVTPAKWFYTNHAFLVDKRPFRGYQGKFRTFVPKHEFDEEKGVRFVFEDDENYKNRQKDTLSYKNIYRFNYRRKARNNQNSKMIELEVNQRLHEEFYFESTDENETEDNLYEEINENNNIHEHKTVNLADYLVQPRQKKRRTNSKVCEQSSRHKKLIYDPNWVKDTVENDFTLIQPYNPVAESAIIFLTDIEPRLENWTVLCKTERWRVVYQPDLAIIICLRIEGARYNRTECKLKIVSLRLELSNIIDIFLESSCLDDICQLAEHLFYTSANKSVKTETAIFQSASTAFTAQTGEATARAETKQQDGTCCQICYSEAELTPGGCGEMFCDSCWALYLATQDGGLKDGLMPCPGFNCSSPVPVSVLAWFLPAARLLEVINQAIKTSVKVSMKKFQCPRRGCARVITFKENRSKEITCVCGFAWCTTCSEPAHLPSTCTENQEFVAYKAKLSEFDRLESKVEVRKCPQCNVYWEKMWGCNMMLCGQCGAGFCWGCGKVHTDNQGVCGSMKVPLDKIEIVAFPTEEFSMRRIETFNLGLQLRQEVLKVNSRDIPRIVRRWLATDRAWYFAHGGGAQMVMETELGQHVTEVVTAAVRLCTRGRNLIINATIKRENATPARRKALEKAYTMLKTLDNQLREPVFKSERDFRLRRITFFSKMIEKYLTRIDI